MIVNPLIDVVLGLVSFYLISSLIVSSIQEAISSFFGLRSKNLKQGIDNFVGSKYAMEIYDHPMIKNLAKEGKLPSYISTKRLSSLFLDIVTRNNLNDVNAKEVLNKIDDNQPIKRVLEHIFLNNKNNIDNLRDDLAEWFDEGMERISGWYKRKIQCITFLIALVLAGVTNSNSCLLAEKLWVNKALRDEISQKAQAMGQEEFPILKEKNNLSNIKLFSLGWGDGNTPQGCLEWIKFFLGILLTTFAVSLGAPFWFDLLGKIVRLKGVGGHKSQVAMKNNKN